MGPVNTNKRRNLMIDDQTLESARVLGGGNASEGVRKAVRHLAGSMSGDPVLAELRQWLDSKAQLPAKAGVMMPDEFGNQMTLSPEA